MLRLVVRHYRVADLRHRLSVLWRHHRAVPRRRSDVDCVRHHGVGVAPQAFL